MFKKNNKLFFAPMHGRTEKAMLFALSKVGGFDGAYSGFISVPKNANLSSLVRSYDPDEIGKLLYVPQILGRDPDLLVQTALAIEAKGAKQIDFNAACPSRYVTAKKRGSYLLKDLEELFTILQSLQRALKIPVSVKIRSGYEDPSRFEEIIHVVKESGIPIVTIHPRTKKDGYRNRADWGLIKQAKTIFKDAYVIGNGDVFSSEDAYQMVKQTGCDGVMIGRGALQNPWIFQEIKGMKKEIPQEDLSAYVGAFLERIFQLADKEDVISPIKGLCWHLFQKNQILQEKLPGILRLKTKEPKELLDVVMPVLLNHWL